MSNKFDIYQHVTDTIIDQLETCGKWTRPWVNPRGPMGTGFSMPTNVTGKTYRGINVPTLWAYASANQYQTHIWGTFKQWKDRGASVRKGERGATVCFWKFSAITDENGEPVTDENGDAKKVPFVKPYTVFNLDQVDGITLDDLKLHNPASDPESIRIDRAESFVKATKADIRFGGDRAFYRAGLDDFIQIPDPTQFKPVNGASVSETYYGTLLHELTHWTGPAHRCDREFGLRFGDQAYAAEELVAEIGAAMLCAILGISPTVREDHASYLAGWLKVLKADKKAIFTASSRAQAAMDYLINKQPLDWDADWNDGHDDQPETVQTPSKPRKAKSRKPKAKVIKPRNDNKPDPDGEGPKGGTKPKAEPESPDDGAPGWLDWLGEGVSDGIKGESIDSPTPTPEKPRTVKQPDWKGYPSPDSDNTIHIPATFKPKAPPRQAIYTDSQKAWRRAGIGKGWGYWKHVNQFWHYPAKHPDVLATQLEVYYTQRGHTPSPASLEGSESLFSRAMQYALQQVEK